MYCRDTESGRRTVEPTDLEPGNVASLDVKTAFDVAKPSVVSRILSSTGVHGHVAAALLAEMQDVQGLVCFANCETEFRCSKCIRQGGVEAPVLWGRVAKYVSWTAEVKWKTRGTCFRGGERQRVRGAKDDAG